MTKSELKQKLEAVIIKKEADCIFTATENSGYPTHFNTFEVGPNFLLPLLLEAYEALLEIEDVNHCDAEIDSSKREELAREALARIEAFANGEK